MYVRSRGLGDCNTAGGYTMQRPSCYLGAQCMTAADFAAAQAVCDNPGPANPTGPVNACVNCGDPGMLHHPMNPPGLVNPPVVTPLPPVVLNSPALPPVATPAASSGIFDSAIAWVQANPLLAAGAAIGLVFVLGRK